MKKNICYLSLFLFLSIPLFSDILNEYDLEIIHSYEIGYEDNQFAIENFDFGDILMGPASISFSKSGNFCIYDKWNKALKVFNSQNWELEYKIDVDLPLYDSSFDYRGHLFDGNWIVLTNYTGDFVGYSLQENSFQISLSNRMNNKCIIIIDNLALFYNKSNILWGLDLNSDDKELQVLEETSSFLDIIESEEGVEFSDENGYLFLDNEFYTRNYEIFFSYWDRYYNGNYLGLEDHFGDGPPVIQAADRIRHIGTDSRGNNYWALGFNPIFVTSPKGILLDFFRINKNGHNISHPTIAPNGDIVYIGAFDGSMNIYRIPNTWVPFDWQPPAEEASADSTAKVTANGLRMRDNPVTTNSTVVASLNEGTIVEILGQTATEETIGTNTDYW